MQSLPTALTTSQLEKLLSDFAELPTAEVTRLDGIITLHATKKKTGERVKVLSAASQDNEYWHVMTVPGLVAIIPTATN
jgi:hypothetical protein